MCAIVRVFVIVGQIELPKVNMLLITGHWHITDGFAGSQCCHS
jgi:hypothetical protein